MKVFSGLGFTGLGFKGLGFKGLGMGHKDWSRGKKDSKKAMEATNSCTESVWGSCPESCAGVVFSF